MEAQIRQLAGELIDKFASRGEAELHDEFCVPLPSLTFLRLVGAPIEDLDFFIDFKDNVIHPAGDTVEEMDANMAVAGAKLLEYFVKFLAERRKETEQKDDVISVLLRSEVDGKPIEELDLLNIMFLLMFAGLDTVTSSLSCIFAWLGQHPEERDRLIADRSLLPAAIEEIMRYESPGSIGAASRRPKTSISATAWSSRRAKRIHAFWAAANVDPTHYDDPLTVNFDRGRQSHIVFASGTHRCLGSHLARMELRIALDEILTRIPDYTVPAVEDLGLRQRRGPNGDAPADQVHAQLATRCPCNGRTSPSMSPRRAHLDRPLTIVATAYLPPPDRLTDQQMVVFAMPGGGYSRGYFDMEFPVHSGYSQAAAPRRAWPAGRQHRSPGRRGEHP